MKKALLSIILAFSLSAQAQTWQDSTITITATQRLAWWVANSLELTWETRKAPDALRTAVGSGTRPDSVFTVTLRAGLLQRAMENLLTRPLLLAIADYRSIFLNQPSVTGYTALATQITNQANQGRGAAIWLRDWYTGRVADYDRLYNEEKNRIIKIVN